MGDREASRPSSSSTGRHTAPGDSHTSSANGTSKEAKEIEAAGATHEDEDDEISIAESRASTISEDHSNAHPKPKPKPPATLYRTKSVKPEAVIVSVGDRRGLFARFSLIPEVENAFDYVNRTKWIITVIVAFCGMAGPMGSAIVMPVLGEIREDFHTTSVIANMSVAVYMLAMGIFPLWWSSFSETGGRRTIYIISFSLFLVFAVLSAVSTNISMLVVVRTFSGGAAASVQAVGAGTIADMWETRERGQALGLFYLGPLCGPLLAPIIGGALGQGFGWRSTQWFLVIYGFITLVLIVFALPETLHVTGPPAAQPPSTPSEKDNAALARISTRQSVSNKTKSVLTRTRRIFIDPLVVLTWMRYPPVALTVYYASITFGSLYFLNISIQATFSAAPYHFSTLILGLLYIPGSVGYVVASILGGRWIDTIMHREARKANRYDAFGKLELRPEDRMCENAWLAAVLWPGALLWYGWTAENGVYWLVPMVANFFFGLGSMLIFTLATTMLTEFMPKRASAGVAINNFFRSMFCFVGAVTAEPIINAIGNGWLMTILGVWSLGSGLAVIAIMKKYGPGWRGKMMEALG